MTAVMLLDGLSHLPFEDRITLSNFGQGPHQSASHSKVHEAFEGMVDAHPDAVAAVFEQTTLSYQELDLAANQLANHLLTSGLQHKQRVCLVVQRSLEMLVGILAILKAGCQYVPIDGGVASDKQLAHIFSDTAAQHILCLPKFQDRVKQFAGAGIYITTLSPARLTVAMLFTHPIDTLISTPSILSKYRKADYPKIKTVVTGGEPCPQSLADEWAEGTCFYNICGPTEITILNSAHQHTPGAALSIGRLLPNTTCYILDENEKPVAPGAKGSAWVGGAGVTRGYINLRQLTSQRYKPDKFRNDGSMMFNTNDIVRWREDGSLETFGRGDDQGFRVELDGVSATIEGYDGISRAAVIKIDDSLHAFYAAAGHIVKKDLVEAVKLALPYYSVPTSWFFVEAIPLTPNGKVDRAMLRKVASERRKRADSVMVTTPTVLRIDTVTSVEEIHQTPSTPLPQPVLHLEKGQEITESEVSTPSSDSVKSIIDVEKGPVVVESGLANPDAPDAPDMLPRKQGFHGQRWVRHRAFILYRRFFSIVIFANLAIAAFIIFRKIGQGKSVLGDLATATASNLCMAVLMRSEPVVNLLFTIFCSVPTSFPLTIRRHCARIFHIGGIHSGCAIAATVFFSIFAIMATIEFHAAAPLQRVSTAVLVLSYLIMALLVAIGSMSHPTIRTKYHNVWEMSHRFGGWTALILLWVHTILATRDLNPSIAPSVAYVDSAPIWLLSIATAAIIFPWLHLRKVPVRSEVLSNHAVRLWFDYNTPVVGTAVRLAERPLVDWHGFATITNPKTAKNPNASGFSLIVSRAGDFTGRTIERAPTHIWVRGIPTCGVLRIATLFKSVVLVATGSGIGPCLAVILAKKVPARILWTAPNPEQTFGKEIVDSVLDTDPHAVIHNTRTMGKPNMSLMAYQLWKESGAEAVCIISNKKFTTKVVYDLEARGIPAYGAIFDS
ncbi:Linear gramicidin synthase subunit C [Stagonosporopsis vannaccii]|nr:Linear gramicidin synthase subunit C [Stagonosporopsis vannaccii]